MFRLCHHILKFSLAKHHKQPNETHSISYSQKVTLLNSVAQRVKLGLKPSIMMSDQNPIRKKLSYEDKIQLGLFIPKSPFNTRLTRNAQQKYLPDITTELYQHQKQNLQTYVRIMQNNLSLQKSTVTLDHYINFIYKDIYARYLILKNIGIQWQGFYANIGVLNSHNTEEYDNEEQHRNNYSFLLDFIQNNAHLIHREDTIGLYSYYERKYIHPSLVEIEKIKRLSYYIKQQLNYFGKYQNQFNILQEQNNKVYMLLMVQRLEKLINPNAICISPNDRFIMLKKYTTDEEIFIQYLIVYLDVYKQHEKYFKDNKYEKHNTFDGKHLLGMKCMNIPIIAEIQGYLRPSNAYVVNSNCHISDFQRVRTHNLNHKPSFVDRNGKITFQKQSKLIQDSQQKPQQVSIYLTDNIKLTKDLQKKFAEEGICFMDFYDVFDDEVYYTQTHKQAKQMLYFRIGEKYSIQIPESNINQIFKSLQNQNTIISESKIKIQSLNTGKRPRQKRKFRKERKQKLEQTTEHLSLEQSLRQLTNISISSLSETMFSVLLFVKDQKIIPYQQVLNEQQIKVLLKGGINQLNLTKFKEQGYKCITIYANQQLLKALVYLKNLSKNKQIRNVIIQPQTQTQQLIPHAIHLNYLINKGKSRGRRSVTSIKSNISLIKLHPTLHESCKNTPIKDLLDGIIKSNQKRQYGLGLQTLRLWTASNDNYLGDRTINDLSINKQLEHIQLIRTVFWNLLSILPTEIKKIQPTLYINKFMLDSIDSFIINVEECYKSMNINEAYILINDFFQNIINQIYVKTIRDKIIAFPNLEQNQQHFFVIRRILELIPVISPLFPFSAFHISRNANLKWPSVLNPKFYENIPLNNQMIKIRVALRNKLILNKLQHAQIYCQSLKQTFSARDLELFFNVNSVTFSKPDIQYRACSLPLKKSNSITSEQKLIIYLSQDHCIRCNHNSKQSDHLCGTCIEYLQEQIAEPLTYFEESIQQKLI